MHDRLSRTKETKIIIFKKTPNVNMYWYTGLETVHELVLIFNKAEDSWERSYANMKA